MSPTRPRATDPRIDSETTRRVRRRRFLALGAGTGAVLLAGCSTGAELDGDGGGGTDGSSPPSEASTGAGTASGTFRLLVSDQPVAIDEFDSLDVSFDRARIFRGEGADEDAEEATTTATEGLTETTNADETESDAGTDDTTETPTPTATPDGPPTETETAAGREEPVDGEQRGFLVVDLGGATVDLTQVVGDKAMGVFDGQLPEGRYTKVELYAASVDGVVDGEPVGVTIPSGKLQLVKPFEVVAGETLRFVFDINVVRKGRTGEYNLLPVISESGVAGRDVEVTEVGTGAPAQGGADSPGTDVEGTDETGADEAGRQGSDGDGSPGDEPGGGPPDSVGPAH